MPILPMDHPQIGNLPARVDTRIRFDAARSTLMQPQAIADAVMFLLTLKGNSTVDEIYVRHKASPPWS